MASVEKRGGPRRKARCAWCKGKEEVLAVVTPAGLRRLCLGCRQVSLFGAKMPVRKPRSILLSPQHVVVEPSQVLVGGEREGESPHNT